MAIRPNPRLRNPAAAAVAGDNEQKRRRALALIKSEDFGTSAQVLQEFFVAVVRKAARPLPASEALVLLR